MRNLNAQSSSRSIVVIPIIIFIVGLILFVVGFKPASMWVQSLVLRIVSPVWSYVQPIQDGVMTQSLSVLPKKELVQRLTDLEQRILENQEIVDRSRVIESEYHALLSLVNLSNTNFSENVFRVLHLRSSMYRDSMVIDAGNHDGISVGQGVVTESGIFLGTVSVVHEHQSIVVLSSHGKAKTPVILGSSVDTTNMALVMEGRGGYHMSLQIPRHTEIAKGDIVAYPGFGLVAGVIEKIAFDSRDPFQQAYVRLPVHPRTIRFVRIFDMYPDQNIQKEIFVTVDE
jgi:cell shape-determining protein MreC